MAIQFQCVGCRQPIEVDDQYANRQAVCPFCRIVLLVPPESSLGTTPQAQPAQTSGDPGGAPPPFPPPPTPPTPPGSLPPIGGWDRPSAPPPLPPAPPSWNPPTGYGSPPGYPPPGYGGYDPRRNPQQAAAIAYGNYAMVCFIIAAALAGIMMVLYLGHVFSAMSTVITPGSTSQPSPAELQKMQEAMIAAVEKDTWLSGTGIGTGFFGLVGFIFAIISLTKSTDNWRGWLSVIGCGVFAICCCGGQLLAMAGAIARG